jgi:hydrogenase/urease accessory protein HupE
MNRLVTVLATIVFAIATALSADGHELGKTQVTVQIRADRTYQVDVAVDPDALLTKLEVFGGGSPSSPADRFERDRRLAGLGDVFLEYMTIEFDGVRAQPRFTYLPPSGLEEVAQAPATAHLAGIVPIGAKDFVLAYGLAAGSFAMNLRIGDSPAQTVWLDGAESSPPISLTAPPPPPTTLEVMHQYFVLGFTHILPKGLDHILFVLGIFLLGCSWRSVLLQVSAFTLAHSITLALTMLGIVSLPARVVEPLIALSIAYVAIENLLTGQLKPWRVALVFSFGLLHGMGFAGVLRDLGLPRSQFLTALLTFNLGVEGGQLTVIALAFAASWHWRRNRVAYQRLIVQPASLVVALTGLYWTVQRAFGL